MALFLNIFICRFKCKLTDQCYCSALAGKHFMQTFDISRACTKL